MQDCSDFTKKRSGLDRRKGKIPRLKYLLFGGQRKMIRRSEDKQKMIILDNYSPRLLAFVLVILTLSLADGFFTLHLTDHGAIEANPVMAYFLDLSPWAFMSVKYLLTTLSVICFLILNNLYIKPFGIRVDRIFPAIIAVFLIVVFWQFFHTVK
ncbi:MAG: DUF5658 family protein [Desulfobacterales bacterium]|jgi:hypothetical protein|nr:DUF5658 family protein [Desulfobacterales bacterium]